jgi:hypothetical protein
MFVQNVRGILDWFIGALGNACDDLVAYIDHYAQAEGEEHRGILEDGHRAPIRVRRSATSMATSSGHQHNGGAALRNTS